MSSREDVRGLDCRHVDRAKDEARAGALPRTRWTSVDNLDGVHDRWIEACAKEQKRGLGGRERRAPGQCYGLLAIERNVVRPRVGGREAREANGGA